MRGGALALACAMLAGCSAPGAFVCLASAQCGPEGTCEAEGFCSFPDGMCPSGQRYGVYAGDGLAGECVDDDETRGTGTTMGPVSGTPPTSGSTIEPTTMPLTMGGSTELTETSQTDEASATMGEDSSSGGPEVPDGIVGWWRLNDDPEDGVRDQSDNALHGFCMSCPMQTSGDADGAYLFTPDAYVVVDHGPAFETETFTVAAWAKADSIIDLHSVIAKPAGKDVWNTWELYFATDDPYRAFFGCGGPLGHALATAPFDAVGEWTHFAGTFDGERCHLYLNGELAATTSQPADGVEIDDHAVFIGADEDQGKIANQFLGEIEDVRVYDRALTEDEVSQLATR